jgi:hypothetical protein
VFRQKPFRRALGLDVEAALGDLDNEASILQL